MTRYYPLGMMVLPSAESTSSTWLVVGLGLGPGLGLGLGLRLGLG